MKTDTVLAIKRHPQQPVQITRPRRLPTGSRLKHPTKTHEKRQPRQPQTRRPHHRQLLISSPQQQNALIPHPNPHNNAPSPGKTRTSPPDASSIDGTADTAAPRRCALTTHDKQ